jgi:hypothetical protein
MRNQYQKPAKTEPSRATQAASEIQQVVKDQQEREKQDRAASGHTASREAEKIRAAAKIGALKAEAYVPPAPRVRGDAKALRAEAERLQREAPQEPNEKARFRMACRIAEIKSELV